MVLFLLKEMGWELAPKWDFSKDDEVGIQKNHQNVEFWQPKFSNT